MALKVTVPIQCRTLEHVILFTPKLDNTLTVKIYKVTCKIYPHEEPNEYGWYPRPEKVHFHQRIFKTKGPNPKTAEPFSFLEHILKDNPLHRSICTKEITIQDCIEETKRLIQEFEQETRMYGSEISKIRASLDLAIDQLQKNKVHETIETLKSILQIDSFYDPKSLISLFLVKLYRASQNKEAALNFALEKARRLTKGTEENLKRAQKMYPCKSNYTLEDCMARGFSEALLFYEQAIILAPNQFTLYREMLACASTPQEKAHYLLMGACHALQLKDFSAASSLCKEAEHLSLLFLDQILQVELLKKQNKPQQVIDSLQHLRTSYRNNQFFDEQLKVDKLLTSREEKLNLYEEIAGLYEELKKPKKAMIWYHKQLNSLIKGKAWEKAGQLADKILNKNPNEISVYQTLKTFYEERQPEKLSVIYSKLGQVQLENNQIDQAEATFKEGLQKFPWSLECAIGLDKVLKLQKKLIENVQQCYAAAEMAFVNDQLKEVSLYLQQIRELDPSFKHLQASQLTHILMLSKIAELQIQVEDLKKEVHDLKEGSRTRLNL